ncbi:MAG: LysM peptidoglycan-binding domain-containing protein [Chthoniobacterales bacterium]
MILRLLAVAVAAIVLTGCNRMMTPRGSQVIKDADARAAEGDFIHAVGLYESALDGSAGAADIHYKLALLYDDKMKDPLNAMHHFKRYLTVAPNGPHANEAKNFMKRDELALLTSLSGDSVVSRAEAARLKNENLSLRKDLEEKVAQSRVAAANDKTARGAHPDKTASSAKGEKPSAKSHVVESGDTLFSLSRKYYGSTSHVKEIKRANSKKLDRSGKLKVGQTITLP